MTIRALITVEACDEKTAESLEKALKVEAENPPDPSRGTTRVSRSGARLVVELEARDYASARALINAYLTLIASLWDTVGNIEKVQEEDKTKDMR